MLDARWRSFARSSRALTCITWRQFHPRPSMLSEPEPCWILDAGPYLQEKLDTRSSIQDPDDQS
eukprot:251832-Rhodomonas_salina.1